MSTEKPYPGTHADISQILDLAFSYSDAAETLFDIAKKGQPLSYAPARLCSIHAIELFLNAFLRQSGADPGQIRGRLHNLADTAFVTTLKLRKKTASHLVSMTEKREYLIARYAPELTEQHSELNRLRATLAEVRKKTAEHLQAATE